VGGYSITNKFHLSFIFDHRIIIELKRETISKMKTIQYLDWDDIIEVNDLVRTILPNSYYTLHTDDEGDSTIYWQYAKWRIPFWVGKTLRQYHQALLNTKGREYTQFVNLNVVRLIDNQLPIGFLIERPPSKIQQEIYGRVIQDNRK